MTTGLIIRNRGFFVDHLAKFGRRKRSGHGHKIATESLRQRKPRGFVDVTDALALELTHGKGKITARFPAHLENIAGGVFGVRITRGQSVHP